MNGKPGDEAPREQAWAGSLQQAHPSRSEHHSDEKQYTLIDRRDDEQHAQYP